MKKILIIISILFLSSNFITPAFSEEVAFPQSDFFLYLGVSNITNDPSASEMVERILFSSSSVEIKNEKITINRSIPINFKNGSQDYNGTASIKMNGDYDKNDGQLSGTFSIKLDMNDVWHRPGAPIPNVKSTWFENINGTFIGQVVNDKVIIRFKGKNNEEEHLGKADGSIENKTLTIDYGPVVVWRLSEYGAPELPKTSEPVKDTVDSGMRFSGMTGQVEWRADDDPDGWKLCKSGDKLPVYAHIRTQEDSSAILSFADMSTFVLKADSEVVIATPPEKESKIKMVAGNIWVNIKKMVETGSMEIEMNQAVAGIKGTTFIASETNGISEIKVIEGEITVRALNGDQSIDIVGGQSAKVDNSGKIVKENFDIIAEQNTWDNPEKIDFAALEKSLSSVQNTAPASDSSIPAKSDDKNQTQILYIAIPSILILIGIIIVFVLRRKK